MRVLIAEDDPVSRRLLESALVKSGYQVVTACDGTEAWNILRTEGAPRLAILDWMMPGMDGVQVCRRVRKLRGRPYVYIILLTARDQRQDFFEGMEAGADDYVIKPFDTRELRSRLHAGKRILDLQSELLSMREMLEQRVTHDILTGLPNRLLFGDRLNQRLAQSRRSQRPLAVMFLDLDHFKLINDTLGHSVGDQLLKQVAQRLTASVREADTVARMGGDEFIAIVADISESEDATVVARRVLETLSQPFLLSGQEIFISASIGVSMYPSDGADPETLVKNADAAMYRAKEHGSNRCLFYTEDLGAVASERVKLQSGLRRALERGEFLLHYQPRVDLKTGEMLGAEALLRWQHPELGLLAPAQFIPLAEETGDIVPIGEWVLRTACAQNKAWQEAGFSLVDIAVNVSAVQFQQGDLVAAVKGALDETGLEPCYLSLELTESILMRNPETAATVLRDLKEVGVQISIDDFGTGHSSLSYLKRFPTDAVKIDQTFVKDITSDPDDAAIAGAMVAMAHSLSLKVVAEGVETLGQLAFLRSLNCDEMQGYFISRPVPADEFIEALQQERFQGEDKVLPAA
ncbi:MAG TPA: EAL domain-containing protein [Armatimonadota bacterium]|nr:EAL domain-containing protein [Armatimonadota bacterium]